MCAADHPPHQLQTVRRDTSDRRAVSVAVLFGGQLIALSFLGYKLEALIRNLRLRGTPITFSSGRS